MLRMLCIIAALGQSGLALADTLIMNNGDRITGRLDSISGGKAVFETRNMRGEYSLASTKSIPC